jgi:hypothetical protein
MGGRRFAGVSHTLIGGCSGRLFARVGPLCFMSGLLQTMRLDFYQRAVLEVKGKQQMYSSVLLRTNVSI